MAIIYIVHVPSDRDAAAQLGVELEAHGHEILFVSDPDTDPTGKFDFISHCDCVIVIWTADSVNSGGLAAIAQEALRMGLLISVCSVNLSVEYIPLDFRKLNTPFVGDIDDILAALSHLEPSLFSTKLDDFGRIGSSEAASPDIGATERAPKPQGFGSSRSRNPFELPTIGSPSGERIGAAPRDRTGLRGGTGAAPIRSPQDEALAVEAGRLVHKIPNKMWLGEQETVEVRLGRKETADLTEGLVGRGALTDEDLPVMESMAVILHSNSGAFDIEHQSEMTQLVMSDHLKGTAFESVDFGRWIWLVTPRQRGSHQLFVRVSASLKDSRGLPTTTTLPDREFKVSVSVHAGRAAMKALRRGILAIAGVVGAALLGAITQDLWWPELKVLLVSWGWLG